MSRWIIVVLCGVFFSISSLAYSDVEKNNKAEVRKLYKVFEKSFNEGNTETALKFARQIYALTPAAYGKISKSHAAAVLNLAKMSEYQQLYYDTAKYYLEHLYILDKMKKPKDESYLSKLGKVSLAYYKIREDKKTIYYAQKSLKLAKKMKLSKGEIGDFELALGLYFTHIYGKRDAAKSHLKKAYRLFSKFYGKDHNKTVSAIFWQARNLLNYGSNRKATVMFETALEIYERNLEPNDIRITNIYGNLVNTYENMDESEKATPYCIAFAKARTKNNSGSEQSLYKVAPEYPPTARRLGIEGYVIGEFTVNEMGQVKDIKIIETTDNIFNEAAVTALSKFRYAPSIKDGLPVKTEGVLHKLSFQIAY